MCGKCWNELECVGIFWNVWKVLECVGMCWNILECVESVAICLNGLECVGVCWCVCALETWEALVVKVVKVSNHSVST